MSETPRPESGKPTEDGPATSAAREQARGLPDAKRNAEPNQGSARRQAALTDTSGAHTRVYYRV
jgi:hypothetical protein